MRRHSTQHRQQRRCATRLLPSSERTNQATRTTHACTCTQAAVAPVCCQQFWRDIQQRQLVPLAAAASRCCRRAGQLRQPRQQGAALRSAPAGGQVVSSHAPCLQGCHLVLHERWGCQQVGGSGACSARRACVCVDGKQAAAVRRLTLLLAGQVPPPAAAQRTALTHQSVATPPAPARQTRPLAASM